MWPARKAEAWTFRGSTNKVSLWVEVVSVKSKHPSVAENGASAQAPSWRAAGSSGVFARSRIAHPRGRVKPPEARRQY